METDPNPDITSETPTHGEVGAAPAARCSPFDLLMDQIGAMRDRSKKYYKESQEEGTPEGDRDAEKEFAIMMVLKELHRLGKHFEANAKDGSPPIGG